MVRLRNEFERLFDEMYQRSSGNWAGRLRGGIDVDVSETDDAFVIHASLPGVDADDNDVTVTDTTATIEADAGVEEKSPAAKYHLRERGYGQFNRSITFPADIDTDSVDCTYDNGVLTLRAPKAGKFRTRRIPIRPGEGGEQER